MLSGSCSRSVGLYRPLNIYITIIYTTIILVYDVGLSRFGHRGEFFSQRFGSLFHHSQGLQTMINEY